MKVLCAISSMSGFESRCSALPARKEGIRTVRGRSFPFELMLGLPIWRDRTREVCASRRWRANSRSRELILSGATITVSNQ